MPAVAPLVERREGHGKVGHRHDALGAGAEILGVRLLAVSLLGVRLLGVRYIHVWMYSYIFIYTEMYIAGLLGVILQGVSLGPQGRRMCRRPHAQRRRRAHRGR